ncbi:MAG: AAA family ATPase [Bacteroidales bacterium]|nr:AAA family ATPase [Bacteroidales bacterium]
MLSKEDFRSLFRKNIPFEPTTGQNTAVSMLSEFVTTHQFNPLFVLKGYAGTGKTTLVSALVKTLNQLHQKVVLLAPTGRAAKVFSVYSGNRAFTIHKHIYRVQMQEGMLHFSRKDNKLNHTLFIVDEVSMISDSQQRSDLFSSRSVLDDLISYVFEGQQNKLLFVGDDAQLPPVHSDESPALQIEYLKHSFNLNVESCQLTDVVRQALDSGILFNANQLRKKLVFDDYDFPYFSDGGFADFLRISGGMLEEELNSLYSKYGHDDIVTITRSNKRAFMFNTEIRNRILFRENQIATGDYLMAVKNNYYWVDESSEVGFIANGDIMEVLSINKIQELYGFHFADVTVRLCDYPQYPNIDVKLILESLDCESASLSPEDSNRLYQEVSMDYQDIADKRLRYLKIKKDPFLNAVQVKFSYSLTCHKTQGGQWPVVLVDLGYLPEDGVDKEFVRWLYTALTRATEKVYLINFKDEMFEITI